MVSVSRSVPEIEIFPRQDLAQKSELFVSNPLFCHVGEKGGKALILVDTIIKVFEDRAQARPIV